MGQLGALLGVGRHCRPVLPAAAGHALSKCSRTSPTISIYFLRIQTNASQPLRLSPAATPLTTRDPAADGTLLVHFDPHTYAKIVPGL